MIKTSKAQTIYVRMNKEIALQFEFKKYFFKFDKLVK
jgi:hypothetical protein